MAKNKQSNLIANAKMLNIGVINKYTINLKVGGWGLFSISYLPIIPLKSLFITPPQLFFSINCRQNRLLHASFIEQ